MIDIEGVFIIAASSKDVFMNRKHKIEQVSDFSTGCLDSYEWHKEDGYGKVIMMGMFENIEDAKTGLSELKKYNWFLDPTLLVNGKEIYSGNKWIDSLKQNKP